MGAQWIDGWMDGQMKGTDEGEGDHFCSPDGYTGTENGGMGSMTVSRRRSVAGRGRLDEEMEGWMDGWMEVERRENASVAPLDS